MRVLVRVLVVRFWRQEIQLAIVTGHTGEGLAGCRQGYGLGVGFIELDQSQLDSRSVSLGLVKGHDRGLVSSFWNRDLAAALLRQAVDQDVLHLARNLLAFSIGFVVELSLCFEMAVLAFDPQRLGNTLHRLYCLCLVNSEDSLSFLSNPWNCGCPYEEERYCNTPYQK